MKKLLCVLGLCSITVSHAFAQMEGLEYSYVRAGYTEETMQVNFLDDVIVSGTAFDFSMVWNDHWAIIASHYSTDEGATRVFDPISGILRPVPVSHEFTALGALYHRPFLEQTDLLASAEAGTWQYWFLNTNIASPRNNEDETGLRLSLGVKSKFFGSLEGALLLRRFQFLNPDELTEDTVTDTVIEGNYYFLEQFYFGGSLIQNDYSDRFVVNAGYSF